MESELLREQIEVHLTDSYNDFENRIRDCVRSEVQLLVEHLHDRKMGEYNKVLGNVIEGGSHREWVTAEIGKCTLSLQHEITAEIGNVQSWVRRIVRNVWSWAHSQGSRRAAC